MSEVHCNTDHSKIKKFAENESEVVNVVFVVNIVFEKLKNRIMIMYLHENVLKMILAIIMATKGILKVIIFVET